MALTTLFLFLYFNSVTASWIFNFPAGWTEESARAQPPHIRPITARYECTVFNFNRWSLPLEAATIYNAAGTPTTNAIAYYRNSKCKDEEGNGLDYVIILNPDNSKGVNVVDLKLDGLTVGGSPKSYQAVDYMHYAKLILNRTGKPPRPGSVYVFGVRGNMRAWSSEPGVVRNVDLGRYTTEEGMDEIQNDPKEIALVLGMITEKVLNEDPARRQKLANFMEKKAGKQTAGVDLPEMLQKMKEYDSAIKAQANGYLGEMMQDPDLGNLPLNTRFQAPMQSASTASNPSQGTQSHPSSGRSGSRQERETMGPPPFQPNRGFNFSFRREGQGHTRTPIFTPYGLANQPIDLYKMAEDCINAGDNRVVWFQWYWAEYWVHARAAKAALRILETVENGDLEAVQKFLEEEKEVQEQKDALERKIRAYLYQKDIEAQRAGQGNFNPGANLNVGMGSQAFNPQEQMRSPRYPTGQPAEQINLGPGTPQYVPQFSRQSSDFDSNFLPGRFPDFSNLGPSGLSSFSPLFNQFDTGPLGMTANQANDISSLRFPYPAGNQEDPITEALRMATWANGHVPSMISEVSEPEFLPEILGQEAEGPVVGEEQSLKKETPSKRLKKEA
ncbi:hypothetical protein TWF718_009910 [Orbilia javanica]|uniref:Uncharacterized protein n=1 Tax=Orbilia javanica TaxID=47235 RepID=A0AAN8N0G6_9PEZI